ncbi:hypothetical protein HDU92_005392 [Lobulomyces angularis]|nr:hypothetical protein HDU92_005392 [Lobulomyces angularis]
MVNFIQKLYSILNDKAYHHCIRWSKNEDSFIVLNSSVFANEVLPLIFKHSNFISFVRQLNLYSFHKVNRAYHRQNTITEEQRAAEHREFSHEKFIKNRPDLISMIQRKVGSSLKRRLNNKNLVIQTKPHSKKDQLYNMKNLDINVKKKILSKNTNACDKDSYNSKNKKYVAGLVSPLTSVNSETSSEEDAYTLNLPSPIPSLVSDILPSTPEPSISCEENSYMLEISEEEKLAVENFQNEIMNSYLSSLNKSTGVQISLTEGEQEGKNKEYYNSPLLSQEYVSVFSDSEKGYLNVKNLLSQLKPNGSPLQRYDLC